MQIFRAPPGPQRTRRDEPGQGHHQHRRRIRPLPHSQAGPRVKDIKAVFGQERQSAVRPGCGTGTVINYGSGTVIKWYHKSSHKHTV